MKRSCILGVVAFAGLLAACAEDEPGTLQVEYRIGPGTAMDCQAFGVSRVRARVGDGVAEAEAACGASLVVRDIKPGNHRLVVEGVDAENVAIVDNLASGANNSSGVLIPAGGQVKSEVTLQSRPATVYVRWALKVAGFPVQCDTASVLTNRFSVVTWAAADRLLSVELACSTPANSGTYVRVNDPDRLIKGTGLTEVSVQPYERSNLAVGSNVRFQLGKAAGAGREVFVSLDCNDNVCVGTGVPPYNVRQ